MILVTLAYMEGWTDGRTEGHDVWLYTKFSPIDDGLPCFLNNVAPRARLRRARSSAITKVWMRNRNLPHFICFLGHKFGGKLIRHEYFRNYLSNQISDISRVFRSSFSGRLTSDNRNFLENNSFPNLLKVEQVSKFQLNSH